MAYKEFRTNNKKSSLRERASSLRREAASEAAANAKGHVPSKKIVDGAALMKFQQLNVDAGDTHLDHSELEDNASLRQMDRDGDGKVSVMEYMLHQAETPLVPTTPAHPVRSARKIPVHAPGCVPDVLSQLRLAQPSCSCLAPPPSLCC